MKSIGVVIPCKDYARFLPDALRSLEDQGMPLRAVVVDDYSKDPGAVQAAAGLVSVIHLPEPCGTGIARNVGAAFLHTDYLLFLDADDTLYEGAAPHLRRTLEAHPDSAFSYGNYTEQGKLIESPEWEPGLLDRINVASYCNLWRREAFWQIGGYSTVPHLDDWEIQRRAARAGLAGAHSGALVFDHRMHGANHWLRTSDELGGLVGAIAWLKRSESAVSAT